MRKLTVTPLVGNQIDQAFPLVQAALPHVTLDQWRDFANNKISRPTAETSGIQSVLTEQNYIAGLGVYSVENDLYHGPTLVTEHFLALDLFNRAAVVHALAEFLEDLGRRCGCTAVHTHIPEGVRQWEGPPECVLSILRERGHIIKSFRVCKILSADRALSGGAEA